MELNSWAFAVKISVIFSGVFLWVGMLTGVWKYWQIKQSVQARAHYYVDIAHRSSLLYAPASLIIAVMAKLAVWSESWTTVFVLTNLIFFSASIVSYILHGFLKDTSNQFKIPHQLGSRILPKWMMLCFMLALIVGELFATGMLLIGTILYLF
jgi:uncharacterized membrane protein YgdD (TMEM256/DUF423 family)